MLYFQPKMDFFYRTFFFFGYILTVNTSSLWNRVIVFQRDGILSTGYFADLTIVFTKLRWQKQSTHVHSLYHFTLVAVKEFSVTW
jgi:hypothetical protein